MNGIAAGLIIGSAIGVAARQCSCPMTHVPQRTAISQACGALASALIRAPRNICASLPQAS